MHLVPHQSSLNHLFVVPIAFAICPRDVSFLLVHAINDDTNVVGIPLRSGSGSVVLQPLEPDFIEVIFPQLPDVCDLFIRCSHELFAKFKTLLTLGHGLVLEYLHVTKPLIRLPNFLKPWPRVLPVFPRELLTSIVNALFPVLRLLGVRQVHERFIRIFIAKFLSVRKRI